MNNVLANTGDFLPWIIAALVLVAVIAGVIIYFVSRRNKKLDVEAAKKAAKAKHGQK